MRPVFGWLLIVVFLGASCSLKHIGEEPSDALLVKAHTDFEEASKLNRAGKYPAARSRIEHALKIKEELLGSTHEDVANCLLLLGDIQRSQGSLNEAESSYKRSLDIHEKNLGKDHINDAAAINSLAAVYMDKGLYERAEPLLRRARALREAAYGPNHPAVANSLNILASLYWLQGKYDWAEPLFKQSLEISRSTRGSNDPAIADSLNNLAAIYTEQGRYELAEPLLKQALAIRQASLGKDHPAVASLLGNLSAIYIDQGRYDLAESMLKCALGIQEAALGQKSPDVATSLDNLANIYMVQGRYGQAGSLRQRALKIRKSTLGKKHPDVALSLENLAILYMYQAQFSRARPLLERAIAIREVVLGKTHPDVASAIDSLALIDMQQGLYADADLKFQRALAIREKYLLTSTSDYADSLMAYAGLRLAQNRLSDAVALFTRAFSISEHRLRLEALDFSEYRLASFLQYLRSDEQILYALLRMHPEDERVRRLALSAVLLLKGRSLGETANISRTVYHSLGLNDREEFERLQSLRTQLVSLSLDGPGVHKPEAYQKHLTELASDGDLLEARLAGLSAPLRALTALPPSDQIVDQVAASLPEDGALVEFVAYEDIPIITSFTTPRSEIPIQPRYLALVLFHDASTRAVDLGPAESMDTAAKALRMALANPVPAPNASIQVLAQKVYQRAFQPLLPLPGTTRRLFLSPDGQLGLIPFAALHDGREFLLDSFDFTYLTSGRDLLPRPVDIPPASSVFVFADPDFNASPSAPASTPGSQLKGAEPSSTLERVFTVFPFGFSGTKWAALEATFTEAKNIQCVLPQTQLVLGAEVTKDRVLHLPTPGILHIATHGTFGDTASYPAGLRRPRPYTAYVGSTLRLQQESMLDSGLVMAGAAIGPPAATIVTALELAGMDLWGTQLVVLSACNTGHGEILNGQGVYGLRRSLVAAGAETVVMSLWTVGDGSTALLMSIYYRHLLQGQGRASALREAMRELRITHPEPHSWAPFIALGSNAPLRAIVSTARWGKCR